LENAVARGTCARAGREYGLIRGQGMSTVGSLVTVGRARHGVWLIAVSFPLAWSIPNASTWDWPPIRTKWVKLGPVSAASAAPTAAASAASTAAASAIDASAASGASGALASGIAASEAYPRRDEKSQPE
jgi:hypothetical protein